MNTNTTSTTTSTIDSRTADLFTGRGGVPYLWTGKQQAASARRELRRHGIDTELIFVERSAWGLGMIGDDEMMISQYAVDSDLFGETVFNPDSIRKFNER